MSLILHKFTISFCLRYIFGTIIVLSILYLSIYSKVQFIFIFYIYAISFTQFKVKFTEINMNSIQE